MEGATEVMIEKLETKEYKEGLISDLDDAKYVSSLELLTDRCAICLSNYEEGDQLRYLPCHPLQHHFHKDCMKVLGRNSLC